MLDRTRTAPVASLIAAASLLLFASAAGAQDQKAAPAKPKRHVDVEIGAGVHFGTSEFTPIEDDFYADFGLATPLLDWLDGEFQLGYWTGRDYDDDDDKTGDTNSNNARSGVFAHLGTRFYLPLSPDAPARVYFSTGPSLMTDYFQDDEVTAMWTLGLGTRLMIGQHSGLLARVPIALTLEDKERPLMLPTVNYFYQF